MPRPPAPIERSSSRSSKRSEPGPAAGPPSPAPDDATLAVGEIVGAHALRGLVRVRAYRPPAPSLTPGRAIVLERGVTRHPMRVISAAPHGRGLVLVGLEGIGDRTAAETLIGARVFVSAADLPPPGDDEFYYHEVVGFT